MIKTQHILILITLFITLYSCNLFKHSTKKEEIQNQKPIEAPQQKLRNFGIGKLIDSIKANYLNYETMSIKFNLEAQLLQEKHQLEGILRIKKDSLIWVSINAPLGIEAARIIINTDSIIFLNKIKKEYVVLPYYFLDNQFNLELNYSDIQSILTNELFLYLESDEERNLNMNSLNNEKEIIRKTFFKDKDSVNYILKTHRKHKLKKIQKKNLKEIKNPIVESIKIKPNIFKIELIEIYDYITNRYLAIKYNDFTTTNNTNFPMSIQFNAQDTTRNISLLLKYNKITLNQNFNFNTTIPSNYKKINP